jgi:hypothetical protein
MKSGPNQAPFHEMGVQLPLAKNTSERRVGRQAGTHTSFADLSSDSPDQRYAVSKPSSATLKSKQVACGWRT